VRAYLLILPVALIGADLGAQPARSHVRGTIRSQTDSAPLVGALVSVRGVSKPVHSDERGVFALDSVPAGVLTLQVRRLGYRPVDTTVHPLSDGTLVIDVWLKPVPRRLVEVEVRGRMILVPAYLRDAYIRGNRNHGTLITAEDIALRNPLDAKAMFEGIPGVHVLTNKIVFIRCSNPGGAVSPFVTNPRVHVYVDGTRVTSTGDEAEAYATIQNIHPLSIELIEVYGGVARIPAEYLVDACAVVAIWTKAR
jgi:hypothetical protein